jgi:hypothetical protein
VGEVEVELLAFAGEEDDRLAEAPGVADLEVDVRARAGMRGATLPAMSDDRDEHLEALRGIWAEMKVLNGRVNVTNERIDGTNERVDRTNERLDRTADRVGKVETGLSELREEVRTGFAELRQQQVQTEIRVVSELVAVVGAVREVGDFLRA